MNSLSHGQLVAYHERQKSCFLHWVRGLAGELSGSRPYLLTRFIGSGLLRPLLRRKGHVSINRGIDGVSQGKEALGIVRRRRHR